MRKIAVGSRSFSEGKFIKEDLLDVADIIYLDNRKNLVQSTNSFVGTYVRRIKTIVNDIKVIFNE